MIIAWIVNSLFSELATSIMCFDSTKDIWSDINERFGQSLATKYIQIQKEINGTSQGSSNIASYFTKLHSLWDELTNSYVGPICRCGTLGKYVEQ